MSFYSRGEETRNTILSSALDLFSKNGYDATSVAEICSRAKISKGAFYYHFPSKQELFLSLMATWLDGVDGLLQEAGGTAENVPEALEKMAGISGAFFAELEGGFPILLEFWTQASRQPAIWEQAVAPYRRYLNYFIGEVQSGIKEGSFNSSLDPEPAARILMAVAMGLLLQASFDPDGADWQEVTRSGIKMIMSGLRRLE